jgi:hypothetical protein
MVNYESPVDGRNSVTHSSSGGRSRPGTGQPTQLARSTALFRNHARVSLVGAVFTCALVLGSESDAAAQASGAAATEATGPASEVNATGATAGGASGGAAARPAAGDTDDAKGESGPPGAGLSGAQLRERADGVIRSIAGIKEQIVATLAAAREKRDVVKVLCLDDKREQVTVALTAANDRKEALDEALLASAAERAQHEFTLLTVLKERVDTLSGEAGQCVGEETGFTGDSELTVAVDPNLPETGSEPPPASPPPPPNLSTSID